VDINPMAAELCRVSLWLEALEPGKPLSFLDHHIRVGNSLLGATPVIVAAGLPDEAFSPVEGDDRKACAILKRLNRSERTGLGPLFAQQDAEAQARLQHAAAALDALPDDRPEAIHAKELAFRRNEQTHEYLQKMALAAAWCAAFVIKKHFRESGREASARGITQRHLNDLAAGTPLPADLAADVAQLGVDYQFFHWHLAFPEVFAAGGFDCILGNPPWEKVKLQEREFFSSLDPAIANARTASDRKQMIARHREADSREWRLYIQQLERDTKASRFYRHSGRFPLTAAGEANTYSIFAELAAQLTAPLGAAGQILKTGIVNAVENVGFYQYMVQTRRLWSVRDFKNWLGWFPDVGYHERFSLVTIAGGARPVTCTYAFNCLDVAEASAPEKTYELSAAQVALLNPNVPVCPVFSTRHDMALALAVYARLSPLVREGTQTNAWGLQYVRMFDMTSDSNDFLQLEALIADGFTFDAGRFGSKHSEKCVPLLGGKHIHGYTHRFATYEGISESERMASRQRQRVLQRSNCATPRMSRCHGTGSIAQCGSNAAHGQSPTAAGALRSAT
jgi:hypothetical protein